VVGQTDLPRVRPLPAPQQSALADAVVWGAERPVTDKGRIRRQETGDGVDHGYVEGFLNGHAGLGLRASLHHYPASPTTLLIGQRITEATNRVAHHHSLGVE
jgi:hypothetical protein